MTPFEDFDEMVSSPMNYIGGKYKLLPQIMPLLPSKVNIFVDLFCGGCNVGINKKASEVIFNDNLTYLIDLYKTFDSNNFATIKEHIYNRIEQFNLSLTNVEGYNSLRSLYNKERNPLDLFVLVAFSFNHQIRFNNSHEFNNPFGRERSYYNKNIENNLFRFVERLKSIKHSFISKDFEDVDLSTLGANDFVYCDPPYLITTGSYNDGKRGFTGWNENEEKRLLGMLNRLNAAKVRFALSNVTEHKGKSNELLIRWAADNNYTIHNLNKNYKNSNYHALHRELETREVLITNYDLCDI